MPAPASKPIRVLLIQVCPIVRAGLRLLLESQPDMRVIGEAPNCREAIAFAAEVPPDVILLDATLPEEGLLDQLPALRATAAGARVLVLLGRDDPQLQQQLLRLGVLGIIQKHLPSEALFKAIAKVQAGEVWIDREMLGSLLTARLREQARQEPDSEATKLALLTAREREIIALVGTGLKNKAIAEQLSISETTVRHHLTAIFSKLGVADRLELVIYAYRQGLAMLPR